ncbi:unnamed protein product [Gordionus sp. m RMFG-2023]
MTNINKKGDINLSLQPRLIRLLSNPEFDAKNYVKEIYQTGDQNDLYDAKGRVQNLYDETAQLLKKNVYKNNSIFIDTARDISFLESEMYHLHQKISQQKTILNNLESITISGLKFLPLKTDKENEKVYKKLFSNSLDEIEDNHLLQKFKDNLVLYQGDMIQLEEMQVGQYVPIHKCKCFLLEDSFIICAYQNTFENSFDIDDTLSNAHQTNKETKKQEARNYKNFIVNDHKHIDQSSYRFKFLYLYPLNTLALINIKDNSFIERDNSVNDAKFTCLIKLLMYPDTLILKANDERSKSEWLNAVDNAKKHYMKGTKLPNYDEQPKITPKLSNNKSDDTKSTMISKQKIETKNTLNEDFTLEESILDDYEDEMEMFIAQRQFEKAVTLLKKIQKHLKNKSWDPSSSITLQEVEQKCQELRESLVELLSQEMGGTYKPLPLSSSPPSSLDTKSPPRLLSIEDANPQVNHYVNHEVLRSLAALGESDRALRLFLMTASISTSAFSARLTLGADPALRAEKIGEIFWGRLAETVAFVTYSQQIFPDQGAAKAILHAWLTSTELRRFITFLLSLLDPRDLGLIARALSAVRSQCVTLSAEEALGLDLVYAFDTLTDTAVSRALDKRLEKMRESSRARVFEERFAPLENTPDIKTSKEFIADLAGFDDGLDLTIPSLSRITCLFLRDLAAFMGELRLLYTPNRDSTFCSLKFSNADYGRFWLIWRNSQGSSFQFHH